MARKKKVTKKACFIRLLTGDDLIADVMENTEAFLSIQNPMIILNNIEMEEGKSTLVLYPWIPQGIAIGNPAKIKQENIMMVNEIEPEMQDYYQGIVEMAFATKPRVTNSSSPKASELEANKGKNVVNFALRPKKES